MATFLDCHEVCDDRYECVDRPRAPCPSSRRPGSGGGVPGSRARRSATRTARSRRATGAPRRRLPRADARLRPPGQPRALWLEAIQALASGLIPSSPFLRRQRLRLVLGVGDVVMVSGRVCLFRRGRPWMGDEGRADADVHHVGVVQFRRATRWLAQAGPAGQQEPPSSTAFFLERPQALEPVCLLPFSPRPLLLRRDTLRRNDLRQACCRQSSKGAGEAGHAGAGRSTVHVCM